MERRKIAVFAALAVTMSTSLFVVQNNQPRETAAMDQNQTAGGGSNDMGDMQAIPIAGQKPHESTHHGITLSDPWAWLRDPDYPTVDDADILDYLKAENAYFEAAMAPHEALTKKIFGELKGRLKKDDASVPVRDGDWLYQWRYEAGDEYKTWVRVSIAGGEEESVLSEPDRAKGFDYYTLGALSVSPDGKLVAFSEDTSGAERFVIRVLDIASGEVLPDEVHMSTGAPVWSADGSTFFYVVVDENWRPYQVRAHTLGTPSEGDRIVYEEPDAGFFLGVGKTQSKKYITLETATQVTSEIRVIPADDPNAEPILIAAREENHQYAIDHAGGKFFIRTNDAHKNFRIVTAPDTSPGRENWQQVIAGSDSHYIRDITAFRDFVAITMRIDGLDQIRICTHDGRGTFLGGKGDYLIEFPESVYTAEVGPNREYAPDTLRISYESMVTPETVFDFHLTDKTLETRKVREIPSGYDASRYKTERLWAKARDGAKVPVSVVYRHDFHKDGTKNENGRVFLIGYGGYGYGYPPSFDAKRLSLLDRGFAVAIAHVRGGDEMGWQWYLDGKLEKRTNSFHDFVDVARYLNQEGWAAPGDIAIAGRSAGGELMGAAIIEAPELWRAAIVGVPFVDVLNTMLDASLPLTPPEWPEWGNPITDKAAFELIRSYSPYDNIIARDYPPMMVTGGLNDPRVTYWEPTKWTAKMRSLKTDDNLLVLKTNMGAGHRGKSGRYGALYEDAEEFVFVLKAFGSADEDQN